MSMQKSKHPFDWLQTFVHNHRRMILLIVFLLLCLITFAYIFGNNYCSVKNGPCWWNSDLIAVLTSLGTFIVLLQIILTIPDQHPSSEPLLELATRVNIIRNIVGRPLLIDPRAIEQRENDIERVYTMLVQPDITAVILTGIVGVGKSTVASLIFRHAEIQRLADSQTFFNAEPVWIQIDRNVTMKDLVKSLCNALKQPIPDLDHLTPENQAAALFKVLNSTSSTRLIILDQLENLIDVQTGYVLAIHTSIGYWLDAINSQPCRCRLLLTCRFWPRGIHDYPPTYTQEYLVKGLESDAGVQLLVKQGVEVAESDLRAVVDTCDGHAGALKELAFMLRNDPNQNLILLAPITPEIVENAQLWRKIAYSLFDPVYKMELNEMQREVLLAFSIYREPVTLEAVKFLVKFRDKLPRVPIRPAVDFLLVHHLLQACGELRYKLHPIVVSYAKGLFDENDEEANLRDMQFLHACAAKYYLQLECPSRGNRISARDMYSLIEATWQHCQAQQLQKAYDLMDTEGIFSDLRHFNANETLLELCQQFLPLEKWKPEHSQASRLIRTLKEVSLELGKEDLASNYNDLFERWLRRRVN
jgi:hypothetical protein